MLFQGLLFAFSYSILYTCSRTFSNVYHYDSLEIGLVLLAYGVGMYLSVRNMRKRHLTVIMFLGSMCGSILGGRFSDYSLRRLKEKNGGKSNPEVCLPPSLLGLGKMNEVY